MSNEIYNKSNKTCKKCQKNFIYFPKETFWNDGGYGYSTKLVKCPYCGCVNVIKHIEDKSLYTNKDSRYYD